MTKGEEIEAIKYIGIQVGKALHNSRLSKNELCRKAQIKIETLNSILKGTKNYTIESLTRVVIVLDMDFLLLKIR